MPQDRRCPFCNKAFVKPRHKCPECGLAGEGKMLLDHWNIPAKRAYYRDNGRFYQNPEKAKKKKYPVAFVSPKGYVVFESIKSIGDCKQIRESRDRLEKGIAQVNLAGKFTIEDIPGFVYAHDGKNPQQPSDFFPPSFCSEPEKDPIVNSENDGEGTVYLITNVLFEGWVKIGCSKNLRVREQSYQTYSPGKYEVYAYVLNELCYELEQKIHNTILSPNPNFTSIREWHNISADNAIELILQKLPHTKFVFSPDVKKSLFEY